MDNLTPNDATQPPGSSLLDTIEIADRASHETDLDLFLREQDPAKALSLWLTHLSPNHRHPSPIGVRALLSLDITELDDLINEQLQRLLHHPRLLKLEATWRGLDLLVNAANESSKINVRVLDITWREISRDIEKALEFDQSQLFQKIYSEEFGTPGGEPYGILIADFEVRHRPTKGHPFDDINTLTGLSQIAAASFAPIILGAEPAFFGVDHHHELNATLDYDKIFQQKEYLKWRAYRDTEDARFVALTLPRTLLRQPRRYQQASYHGLNLSAGTDTYCWGNACFAFGLVLLREFAHVGWFSHIRGTPRDELGGGLVTDLPITYFHSDAPQVAIKPITNAVISDELEKLLGDQGFIPLCQCYDTPFAAFHSNHSTQRPKTYTNADATINARLSAMIQHILCASRFAHYIKVMIRDKVGSFFSANDCENYLQRWLTDYIAGSDSLEWEMQAKYPLRDASVTVLERPDMPGTYSSVIHLKPHYQLDQMVSELKLMTELASVTARR